MLRKCGVLLVGLLAASIVASSSTGARVQTVAPSFDLATSAGLNQFLKAHGIAAKSVVVQRGAHNYAGPLPGCRGAAWTCTSTAPGKVVVQFGARDDDNQFQCTPSTGGSNDGANNCTVVQVSDGGNNDAKCIERTSVASGVTQNCTIQQVNTTGDNHAQVDQDVNANGGAAQDATQNASVSQQNGSGQNDAHVSQSINQETKDSGSGGSQAQDGHQIAAIGQQSGTGDNHADVKQSLQQSEHLGPAGGKNAVTTVKQSQNTNGSGPNLNGAVYQASTGGGKLDGHIDQSIDEHADAPGKSATGTQTQGHPGGGVNGHFDQSSSGVASAKGTQHEHQDFSGSSKTLTQTQFDPAWMGSPQGTNTADKYDIDQHTEQNASNSAADQHDQIFSNCDTTGICTANEDTNQDGTHQRNTCSGSVCHIATSCESGGEVPGCTTSTSCDGPCGGSPPPPPPNPLDQINCGGDFCGGNCGIDCITTPPSSPTTG